MPGSHRDALSGKSGFCREKPKQTSVMQRIEIPPGHLVIFYQQILHEVQRQTCPRRSLRLFVGWRLTRSTLSLQDLAAKTQPGVVTTGVLVKTQGVPLLPSGQQPPMYAKNHLNFWREGLITWLTRCGPTELRLVPRFFPSLEALGLPLYANYTEEELNIMSLGAAGIELDSELRRPAEEWRIFGKHYRLWPDFEPVSLRPFMEAGSTDKHTWIWKAESTYDPFVDC
eukprot:g15299.t1